MPPPLMPSGISLPVANRGLLLTDIQMLAPHCYKDFVEIYGQQSYVTILDVLRPVKQFVPGRDFFHFEDRGKLQQKVTVQTAIVAPVAGADITVVATAGDHFNAGTQSPFRDNEVVRISSSGFEGKIVSVNKTTPNAHSAVIRPLKTTVALVSAGSANLLAGEMLEFKGVTEAGERSDAPDPIIPLENKISNTTTEIREVWRQTDRSMIEELNFNFNGQPFYKYRGMDTAQRRFLNSKAFKLLMGDSADNLGALGGSVGTQGAIPRTRTGGQTLTYTPGSMSITDIHAVTRTADFNGGAQEYHWLQDVFQNQEFNDELFGQYNGGAIIWNSVGGSADIAIGYGFASVAIDGYTLHLRKELVFSPEAVYGAAPTVGVPEFRNFGWFVPQQQHTDPVRKATIPSVRIVYNAVEGDSEIKVWETGAFANANKTNVAELCVNWLQYCGMEMFGANQFIILEAA
jgi:hypothetical protein